MYDMHILTARPSGNRVLMEMRELAQIPNAAQRYIRRSLELRFGRRDLIGRRARSPDEERSMTSQVLLYEELDAVRAAIPVDDAPGEIARFMTLAAELAAFDLGERKIRSFAAFRFLYERLLGAAARPWLLGTFLMCAALPRLHPAHRLELLRSVDADAAGGGWSLVEPQFYPGWIDRLEG
jgi:hypothetical protein